MIKTRENRSDNEDTIDDESLERQRSESDLPEYSSSRSSGEGPPVKAQDMVKEAPPEYPGTRRSHD